MQIKCKRLTVIKPESILKNSIVYLTFIFFLLYFTSCDKETVIPEQDIPGEIKSYVSTHFPDCAISKAMKEKDKKDEMYEISLSCHCKLEFNKQKNIIDIDCSSKLPDSVVPNNILSYVNTNYPNNYIVGWEIQGNNQNIDLNNKVTLIFNKQGVFIYKAD